MANFDSEFFGLVFPGFQATQKIHAQNSRPELSAFLSSFTFLNTKFIHGDFLLTGETNRFLQILAHLQKNSRRLELSISQNTPRGRWGQGPGSVDPRFPAGLPFPVPEILEFVAFRDSGKKFQQFSRDFPGVFLGNPRTDPGNSHSLLEFSDIFLDFRSFQSGKSKVLVFFSV